MGEHIHKEYFLSFISLRLSYLRNYLSDYLWEVLSSWPSDFINFFSVLFSNPVVICGLEMLMNA